VTLLALLRALIIVLAFLMLGAAVMRGLAAAAAPGALLAVAVIAYAVAVNRRPR
jgi:hypothetical protein